VHRIAPLPEDACGAAREEAEITDLRYGNGAKRPIKRTPSAILGSDKERDGGGGGTYHSNDFGLAGPPS
jgi:hypothetical protein